MLRTSKNSFKAIRTDDVIYVESEGHNLKYVTAEETYICTGKLDNEFAKPPAGFIRCHKSFCVNMRKISGYNGDDIIIDGYPLYRCRVRKDTNSLRNIHVFFQKNDYINTEEVV